MIRAQLHAADQPLTIARFWLADIRANGSLAYQELPGMTLDPNRGDQLLVTASFNDSVYGADARLRISMRSALIADGLAEDEA